MPLISRGFGRRRALDPELPERPTDAVALVTLLIAHHLSRSPDGRSRIARIIDHPPRHLVARGKIQDCELARVGLTTADV